MKIIKSLFAYSLIIITVLLAQGCNEPKNFEIKSSSPDKKNTIVLKGKKSSFADPIMVSFGVEGETSDNAPLTEIYAAELSEKTVKFEWASDNECHITFTQQDGTQRTMHAHVGPNGFSLHE